MKESGFKAVLCAIFGNIIWGFSFLFIRWALNYVQNPTVMLAHRFTCSTIMMLIPILLRKVPFSLKGKNWMPILALIFTQQMYYLFESYGIVYTNTTISGLVLAMVPVTTIATGALFLKEFPKKKQVLFCILPVAGVVIMTLSGNELGVVTPIGMLFLGLTLLSSSFYKTANRAVSKQLSPFERTFLVLSSSAVMFSFEGLRSVGWNMKQYLAPFAEIRYAIPVLCLSFLCSILANLLVNYASARMSVFKIASFGSLSTLCSTIAGVVLLNEPMSGSLLLGAVLILTGIHCLAKYK